MPNVQTAYNENMRPGIAGAQADMTPSTILSRTVETAAGIGFGKVVRQGTGDKGIISDLATVAMDADSFVGITVVDRGVANPVAADADKYPQYSSARVMTKGTIWVEVAGAVAAGTDVTVTLATGVLGSASVGAGVVAIPRARWETSTAGAGLAVVRLQ